MCLHQGRRGWSEGKRTQSLEGKPRSIWLPRMEGSERMLGEAPPGKEGNMYSNLQGKNNFLCIFSVLWGPLMPDSWLLSIVTHTKHIPPHRRERGSLESLGSKSDHLDRNPHLATSLLWSSFWTRHPPLNINFFICKMGIITAPVQQAVWRIRRDDAHIKHVVLYPVLFYFINLGLLKQNPADGVAYKQ